MISPDAYIHNTAIVDEGATVEAGAKIWHFVHILRHTSVGANTVLGQNVMVGPDVIIGTGCKIQNNVALYKGVTLERDVFCGPSCVFTNVKTPRAFVERKDEFSETLVKQGATIGANATILCGNTLGRFCMIAAGAVVTKCVLDYALMAGVPAKRIGWVSREGEVLGPDLTCPRTGERYVEIDGFLSPQQER
jgi:UDP-2-acetamido-3-amino-2,3-dideoxy-glucuronate N-acetyltransferase